MRRGSILLASSLLAVALGGLSLGGAFVWDDHSLIREQAAAPDALARAFDAPFFWERAPNVADYYRPLVSLALALQWRVFGAEPFGYHLVSLLLHAGCTLLVALWLERRLSPATQSDTDLEAQRMLLPAVLLGSAFFAAHPSRVQVVSWISGSTDLWSALFALLALTLVQRGRNLGTALLAGLCGALAVAAKETAIALPFAIALDTWLRSSARPTRRDVQAIGSMLALSLVFFFVRGRVVDTPLSALWSNGLWSLMLRVLFTLGWDVAAVFAPTNPRMQLNFDLAVLERLDPEIARYAWLGAGAALLGVALLVAALRRPALRGFAADLLVFFVLLAPSLNLVPIGRGTTCSERFLYLPLLGLVAAYARGVLVLTNARVRSVAAGLSLLILAGLTTVSARETAYFADDRALQEHFYRQDPTELLTLRKLIKLYARANEVGRARFMNQRLLHVLDNVATPPVTALTRAANLIQYAVTDAQLVTDDNQARLTELRSFFDAASQPEGRASLKVDGKLQTVAITRAVHDQLAKLEGGTLWLEEARIMAHARSLDLEGAERAARALRDKSPESARAQALCARLAAFSGRFEEALALWPVQDPKLGRDGFVPAVQQARADVEGAKAHGAIASKIAEAIAVAQLGLPARGRVLLGEVVRQVPLKPPLVEAQIRVEMAGRRPARALSLLQEAVRKDPENAGLYRAWQQWLGGN